MLSHLSEAKLRKDETNLGETGNKALQN